MGSVLVALAESSIQLVPDGTMIIHGLIILIMVGVLNLTLFKPINRILVERELQTRGRLDEARLTLTEIDRKVKDYERTLREARAEGYQLMEQQRAEALHQRDTKLSSVKEEVANFLAAQKRIIAQQADDVRSTLSSEARRLAAEISARILGRP